MGQNADNIPIISNVVAFRDDEKIGFHIVWNYSEGRSYEILVRSVGTTYEGKLEIVKNKIGIFQYACWTFNENCNLQVMYEIQIQDNTSGILSEKVSAALVELENVTTNYDAAGIIRLEWSFPEFVPGYYVQAVLSAGEFKQVNTLLENEREIRVSNNVPENQDLFLKLTPYISNMSLAFPTEAQKIIRQTLIIEKGYLEQTSDKIIITLEGLLSDVDYELAIVDKEDCIVGTAIGVRSKEEVLFSIARNDFPTRYEKEYFIKVRIKSGSNYGPYSSGYPLILTAPSIERVDFVEEKKMMLALQGIAEKTFMTGAKVNLLEDGVVVETYEMSMPKDIITIHATFQEGKIYTLKAAYLSGILQGVYSGSDYTIYPEKPEILSAVFCSGNLQISWKDIAEAEYEVFVNGGFFGRLQGTEYCIEKVNDKVDVEIHVRKDSFGGQTTKVSFQDTRIEILSIENESEKIHIKWTQGEEGDTYIYQILDGAELITTMRLEDSEVILEKNQYKNLLNPLFSICIVKGVVTSSATVIPLWEPSLKLERRTTDAIELSWSTYLPDTVSRYELELYKANGDCIEKRFVWGENISIQCDTAVSAALAPVLGNSRGIKSQLCNLYQPDIYPFNIEDKGVLAYQCEAIQKTPAGQELSLLLPALYEDGKEPQELPQSGCFSLQKADGEYPYCILLSKDNGVWEFSEKRTVLEDYKNFMKKAEESGMTASGLYRLMEIIGRALPQYFEEALRLAYGFEPEKASISLVPGMILRADMQAYRYGASDDKERTSGFLASQRLEFPVNLRKSENNQEVLYFDPFLFWLVNNNGMEVELPKVTAGASEIGRVGQGIGGTVDMGSKNLLHSFLRLAYPQTYLIRTFKGSAWYQDNAVLVAAESYSKSLTEAENARSGAQVSQDTAVTYFLGRSAMTPCIAVNYNGARLVVPVGTTLGDILIQNAFPHDEGRMYLTRHLGGCGILQDGEVRRSVQIRTDWKRNQHQKDIPLLHGDSILTE